MKPAMNPAYPPHQCGETDLHVPHDWEHPVWGGVRCSGLDGTETDPDKPPRPDIDTADPPDQIPGWDRVVVDPNGHAVCGWTTDDEFHAYATIEHIASVLLDALQEITA